MNDTHVAQTILSQLGGNRFVAMTGVKHLVNHGEALSMKFGRNSSNSNYLKITLNSMDTYDMRFSKVTPKGGERSITEYNGIYNDMLAEIFTEHTGLYTSL